MDPSDAGILFVDLFDWDPQSFRDMALVMALVVASPKHPELAGRSILVERSATTIMPEEPDRSAIPRGQLRPGTPETPTIQQCPDRGGRTKK